MPQESFLARRSFGVSNWLLIAVATCFLLGFIPRGVKQSIKTNSNNAADWLPASYSESQDLLWFRDHFISAQFVLASWDGCTLGDTDKLRLLATKLRAAEVEGKPLFSKVITGPEMIETLTQEPARLPTRTAIKRLEGALIGPPKLGADGESLGADSRTTCLIAYLSSYSQESNLNMRTAVTAVQSIAADECGVKSEQLHLGGPPVDNITIDIEGEKTLRRLAILSGVVGLSLAFWFFRSVATTLAVFAVAGISAGASLAGVYYYSVVWESWLMQMDRPRIGTVDAILLSMPAVVYVLGLAGAIHLVNYYRDERDEHGIAGAVERAVRIGWGPCALAALTTAVGLGSLAGSDIVPIMKFGGFTALGVMVTVAILFTVLPVFLHVAPPKLRGDDHPDSSGHSGVLPPWAHRYVAFVTTRHGLVTAGCFGAMALLALGLPQIKTSVQLLKLLDPDVDLIHDYAWLEEHLGNLVPMEVVVALTPDQLKQADEDAVGPDGQYRMSMYERMHMAQRLERRVESLDEVSRALSAASFGPEEEGGNGIFNSRAISTTSRILEANRGQLVEYMREEITPEGEQPRELWRVSARVAALKDIDYGQFVNDLRDAVEPVLTTYTLRSQLVKQLHDEGAGLRGAKVCIVYQGEGEQPLDPSEPAGMFISVLDETGPGIRQLRMKVSPLSLNQLAGVDEQTRAASLKALAAQDAVVAPTAQAAAELAKLAPNLKVIAPLTGEEPGVPHPSVAFDRHSSLHAVYTGIVPLVYKTQRELLASLRESIGWATLLIAGVMMLLFRNIAGGVISMIPNVFPIIIVFGAIGWIGIKVDIGIMMTASVALGVAVDDTIHFLTWFRRHIREGHDRQTATRLAYERCAVAMVQTTLIAGLGLAVFATSTFTPTQQFGTLMITILGAALVGDLLMLPAILCGPLGWCFAPKALAVPDPDAPFVPAARPEHAAAVSEQGAARSTASPSTASPTTAAESPATSDTPADTPDGSQLAPSNAALRSKLQSLRRRETPR
ncbi:MMPL family protein [Posidoniimonas polymericola]|uniref:MMPL family protein n=1 Tax=Posidoniimonas polymericola TaxID=2528002 RepID=A0A5C5YUQ6_9BACT|nr:MMPL family transporter [Posidoniimonas polymericola]TWT78287.1 MMPL family protein [Posidoniimonas polymericola]